MRGLGAVAIFNLMEDAATAEISRSQIWQWIKRASSSRTARRRPRSWPAGAAEELTNIRAEIGEDAYAAGHWQQAQTCF